MPDRRRTRAALAPRTIPDVLAHETPPSTSGPPLASEGSIREFNIPLSDLCTAEFQRVFSQPITPEHPARLMRSIPDRSAPKSEWDVFDEWFEERLIKPPLAIALKRYPVQLEETVIAGVPVSIVTPHAGITPENDRRILINLHGGGFVVCRGTASGQLESVPVAALGRIKVVTLDYRQAPFHHYPAASEDVEAVYCELLQQYRPESIGIYGCSAGGVLTAQALARFQKKDVPRPGAVGLFNMAPPPPFGWTLPWERGWGDSGLWFSGALRNRPTEAEIRDWQTCTWYMNGAQLEDPLAYPGAFDDVLAMFPPTLFMSGTRDFAMSGIISAHSKFLRLRVDSSLYVMEGAPHAAHLTAVGTPEAHDAHSYIARWFSEKLE